MDKTSQLFDRWAKTGRAEEMEKGHGTTVNKFLDKLTFNKSFTFLDIGCGNGDLSFYLSNKFINSKFYGIDYDKNNIKFANRKSRLLNKKKQLSFKNINFRKFKPKKNLI